MTHRDVLADAVDLLRERSAGFVYENHDRSAATVGSEVRVLILRPGVTDAFGALDGLIERWSRLTAAVGTAADARLGFYLSYEAQARRFGAASVTAPSAFPDAFVMVPRVLLLVDLDAQEMRRVGLPWSEELLGNDFEETSIAALGPNEQATPISTSREEYLQRVHRTQDAIRDSEIEQAVISMTQAFVDDTAPEDLYLALRSVNPSPQMFLFKGPAFALAGSSPLRMLALKGRSLAVETDGGTRPIVAVGGNEEWVPTIKERQEHQLLVAALHSDIRSVVEPGSMVAGESLVERRFSHVRHLFASAGGTLKGSITPGELLRSLSPHGAVTGAPRAGAIAVIERVEGAPRGPYGGIVGTVGPVLEMDVACVIRSFVQAAGVVAIQTGAGIVELSEAEDEYDECLDKARALVDALKHARSGS